jgi:predicted nucleic acid-binding protein
MGDTYILDTNVLKDIARGNDAAGEALKKQIQTGTQVTIAQAAYNEITNPPNDKALGAQYREILSDLNIKPAPPGSMADRVKLYADNIQHTPGKNQPGSLAEYGKGANKGVPADAFVAAQAKSTGYKLWTFDADMKKRAPQFGVALAPESSMKGVSGTEDPARARRTLGLPPIEINAQGVVTRRHPFGSPYGQTGTIPTPEAPDSRRTFPEG